MTVRKITKDTLGRSRTGWVLDRRRNLFTTWEVDVVRDGKRYRRRGFESKAAAEQHVKDLIAADRLREIGLLKSQEYPTVWELFKKRLRDIDNKKERVRAQRVMKKFLSITGKDLTIDLVARKHFKDFADERIDEGVSKKTVNREINPIAKAFSSAPDYFELRDWRPPRVFKFRVSREGRKRVLTELEYTAFLEYFLSPRREKELDKDYRARKRTGLIFKMLLMTGLRHGEVCGMRKDRLDRENRVIDVYRFKTSRWKGFGPLTPTHLELLDQGAGLYPKSKYFFSADGKIHNKTYSIVKKACEEIGIPYGRFTEGGFVFHDLRHSFTTILHQNLIDNRTTTEFTDNPSAVGDYQHATEESKKRAMAVIEKKFGNGNGRREEAAEVFERIRNGEIELGEFLSYLDAIWR